MIVACKSCNKEFKTAPANIARNHGKYCSVDCHRTIQQSNKITKECPNCNKVFQVKKSKDRLICCSKKCSVQMRKRFVNGVPVIKDDKLYCHTCKEHKNFDNFYTHKTQSDLNTRLGRFKHCKKCWMNITEYQRRKRVSSIEGTIRELIKRSKCVAKNKRYGFNLDFDYVISLYRDQNGKCAISGEILETASYYNPKTISIDKIIPGKGYLKGNIQLVCWVVNQMKNDLSTEELLEWCCKISKNTKICLQ